MIFIDDRLSVDDRINFRFEISDGGWIVPRKYFKYEALENRLGRILGLSRYI